jgi:hypothetical protein
MSRKRRNEREFASQIAKECNITPRQAKKRYVTRAKDMSFMDNW